MQATLVAALLTGATAAVQSRRSLLRVGCTTTVTPFASAAACKGDECIKEKRRTFDRAGRTLVVDQEFVREFSEPVLSGRLAAVFREVAR